MTILTLPETLCRSCSTLHASSSVPSRWQVSRPAETTTHIAFEMLKRAANVNMTFVPYPGNAPAVDALSGWARHFRICRLRGSRGAAEEPGSCVRSPFPHGPGWSNCRNVPEPYQIRLQGLRCGRGGSGWSRLANTPKDTLSQFRRLVYCCVCRYRRSRRSCAAPRLLPVRTCGADFWRLPSQTIRGIRPPHCAELNVRGG